MIVERRSILKGLVALVAAPAIVKVSSLMPVNGALQPRIWRYDQLSMRFVENYVGLEDGATRLDVLYGSKCMWPEGAVIEADGTGSLPKGTRALINEEYDRAFSAEGAKIGDILRILLPSDYALTHGPVLGSNLWLSRAARPRFSDPAAFAIAAVAIAPQVLAKPVTRRFWARS